MWMHVVLESYRSYQNGSVSSQLMDIVGGEDSVSGINAEFYSVCEIR
jgi:hypothetical protein